jgi:hypothetical protein
MAASISAAASYTTAGDTTVSTGLRRQFRPLEWSNCPHQAKPAPGDRPYSRHSSL